MSQNNQKISENIKPQITQNSYKNTSSPIKSIKNEENKNKKQTYNSNSNENKHKNISPPKNTNSNLNIKSLSSLKFSKSNSSEFKTQRKIKENYSNKKNQISNTDLYYSSDLSKFSITEVNSIFIANSKKKILNKNSLSAEFSNLSNIYLQEKFGVRRSNSQNFLNLKNSNFPEDLETPLSNSNLFKLSNSNSNFSRIKNTKNTKRKKRKFSFGYDYDYDSENNLHKNINKSEGGLIIKKNSFDFLKIKNKINENDNMPIKKKRSFSMKGIFIENMKRNKEESYYFNNNLYRQNSLSNNDYLTDSFISNSNFNEILLSNRINSYFNKTNNSDSLAVSKSENKTISDYFGSLKFEKSISQNNYSNNDNNNTSSKLRTNKKDKNEKSEISSNTLFYSPSTLCNYYQHSNDVTPSLANSNKKSNLSSYYKDNRSKRNFANDINFQKLNFNFENEKTPPKKSLNNQNESYNNNNYESIDRYLMKLEENSKFKKENKPTENNQIIINNINIFGNSNLNIKNQKEKNANDKKDNYNLFNFMKNFSNSENKEKEIINNTFFERSLSFSLSKISNSKSFINQEENFVNKSPTSNLNSNSANKNYKNFKNNLFRKEENEEKNFELKVEDFSSKSKSPIFKLNSIFDNIPIRENNFLEKKENKTEQLKELKFNFNLKKNENENENENAIKINTKNLLFSPSELDQNYEERVNVKLNFDESDNEGIKDIFNKPKFRTCTNKKKEENYFSSSKKNKNFVAEAEHNFNINKNDFNSEDLFSKKRKLDYKIYSSSNNQKVNSNVIKCNNLINKEENEKFIIDDLDLIQDIDNKITSNEIINSNSCKNKNKDSKGKANLEKRSNHNIINLKLFDEKIDYLISDENTNNSNNEISLIRNSNPKKENLFEKNTFLFKEDNNILAKENQSEKKTNNMYLSISELLFENSNPQNVENLQKLVEQKNKKIEDDKNSNSPQINFTNKENKKEDFFFIEDNFNSIFENAKNKSNENCNKKLEEFSKGKNNPEIFGQEKNFSKTISNFKRKLKISIDEFDIDNKEERLSTKRKFDSNANFENFEVENLLYLPSYKTESVISGKIYSENFEEKNSFEKKVNKIDENLLKEKIKQVEIRNFGELKEKGKFFNFLASNKSCKEKIPEINFNEPIDEYNIFFSRTENNNKDGNLIINKCGKDVNDFYSVLKENKIIRENKRKEKKREKKLFVLKQYSKRSLSGNCEDKYYNEKIEKLNGNLKNLKMDFLSKKFNNEDSINSKNSIKKNERFNRSLNSSNKNKPFSLNNKNTNNEIFEKFIENENDNKIKFLNLNREKIKSINILSKQKKLNNKKIQIVYECELITETNDKKNYSTNIEYNSNSNSNFNTNEVRFTNNFKENYFNEINSFNTSEQNKEKNLLEKNLNNSNQFLEKEFLNNFPFKNLRKKFQGKNFVSPKDKRFFYNKKLFLNYLTSNKNLRNSLANFSINSLRISKKKENFFNFYKKNFLEFYNSNQNLPFSDYFMKIPGRKNLKICGNRNKSKISKNKNKSLEKLEKEKEEFFMILGEKENSENSEIFNKTFVKICKTFEDFNVEEDAINDILNTKFSESKNLNRQKINFLNVNDDGKNVISNFSNYKKKNNVVQIPKFNKINPELNSEFFLDSVENFNKKFTTLMTSDSIKTKGNGNKLSNTIKNLENFKKIDKFVNDKESDIKDLLRNKKAVTEVKLNDNNGKSLNIKGSKLDFIVMNNNKKLNPSLKLMTLTGDEDDILDC